MRKECLGDTQPVTQTQDLHFRLHFFSMIFQILKPVLGKRLIPTAMLAGQRRPNELQWGSPEASLNTQGEPKHGSALLTPGYFDTMSAFLNGLEVREVPLQ